MNDDEYSHLWPGLPLALASAVLLGATPPLSKLLLGEMSPFLLTGHLYLGQGSASGQSKPPGD